MDAASYAVASYGTAHSTRVSCQQRLRYALAWRQKKLVVCAADSLRGTGGLFVIVEGDRDWLRRCLKRSPTQLVLLDPALGAADLELWAELCRGAGKPAFLLSRSRQRRATHSRRLLEACLAGVVLLLTSPVILVAALTLATTMSSSVFERSWCVGMQGRLYRELRFSTQSVDRARWLEGYGFERLPRLVNILRGQTGWFEEQPYPLEHYFG